MLNPRVKKIDTYEEMMTESLSKIPIYTEEWTDFNPSDPGITILEYLNGFLALQNESVAQVPALANEKLLELLGYKRRPAGIARVLIETRGVDRDFDIPADCRFMVGDISFETTKKRHMNVFKPIGCYTEKKSGIEDKSDVLRSDVNFSIKPFGRKPENNTRFYVMFDSSLARDNKGMIYITIPKNHGRNEIVDAGKDAPIRDIQYEYMSHGEYRPLTVEDETLGFIRSGEFRFSVDDDWDETEILGKRGYAIRVTLRSADIDIAPEISAISGSLFEAFQKKTEVITYTFTDPTDIEIVSAVLDVSHIRVYAREKKNGPYYRYEINSNPLGMGEAGRFYRSETIAPGRVKVSFSKDDFGYAPIAGKDAVKVVIYSEMMSRVYRLSDVFGYDNQVIKLPTEHIVRDTFTVVAETVNDDGVTTYSFLKPDNKKAGGLQYTLDDDEGVITIVDAGDYIGARLFLGSLAVSKGEMGNLRVGNHFEIVGGTGSAKVDFINPCEGRGGRFKETIDELRHRMVMDIYKPYSAVVESDFEEIVKTAPGLVIKKVKAYVGSSSNDIYIAVLPGSMVSRPKLSKGYRRRLENLVDRRRLLGQRVTVVDPRFVAVNVRATIYVKPHRAGVTEEVEGIIRGIVDYINNPDATFGDVLSFDELFFRIEALEGVVYVKELSINSVNPLLAVSDGPDIVPEKDVLLVPGEISIRTVNVKE